MSRKRTPVEHAARLVVVDHDLGHRRLARPPAGVRLGVDHHDGRLGSIGTSLDRHQRDREQLDHRPVLGPGDHAVDRQDDRLARLAVLDQGLQAEHAGQGVGVGIDVRDQDDPRERGQGRQQSLRAMLSREEPVRVGFGHHRGLIPEGPTARPEPRRRSTGHAGPIAVFRRRVYASRRRRRQPFTPITLKSEPGGGPRPAQDEALRMRISARNRPGSAGIVDGGRRLRA